MKIPKIILQTSRKVAQYNYVEGMLSSKAPGWDYVHFNDNQIIRFFNKNPLEDFPDIINKFNSIKNGAHKADLFRYYFLYINGGVFIDDDAMLQCNLDTICGDYDFFSVNSSYCPGCIFQGFLGTTKNNKIVYEALKDAYILDVDILNNDYLLICRNLFNIINSKQWDMNIKLYSEVYGNDKFALTIDENNRKVVLAHYQSTKIVPPYFFHPSHLQNKRNRNK